MKGEVGRCGESGNLLEDSWVKTMEGRLRWVGRSTPASSAPAGGLHHPPMPNALAGSESE